MLADDHILVYSISTKKAKNQKQALSLLEPNLTFSLPKKYFHKKIESTAASSEKKVSRVKQNNNKNELKRRNK